jgi:hypothetical protein
VFWNISENNFHGGFIFVRVDELFVGIDKYNGHSNQNDQDHQTSINT